LFCPPEHNASTDKETNNESKQKTEDTYMDLLTYLF